MNIDPSIAPTIRVNTPECTVCEKTSVMEVDRKGFAKWKSGDLIQLALPTLTDEDRELLMTGTHPKCWETMFAGFEGFEN